MGGAKSTNKRGTKRVKTSPEAGLKSIQNLGSEPEIRSIPEILYICNRLFRKSCRRCELKFKTEEELERHFIEEEEHGFPYLKLPPELRLRILRHLIFPRPLVINDRISKKTSATRPYLNFQLVNRQCHNEGREFLLRNVHFLVSGIEWPAMMEAATTASKNLSVRSQKNSPVNVEREKIIEKFEMAKYVGLPGLGIGRLSGPLVKEVTDWTLFLDLAPPYIGDVPQPAGGLTLSIEEYQEAGGDLENGRFSYPFLVAAQFSRHCAKQDIVIKSLHVETCNSKTGHKACLTGCMLPLWQVRGVKEVTFSHQITDMMGKDFINRLTRVMKSKKMSRGDIGDMHKHLQELVEPIDVGKFHDWSTPDPNFKSHTSQNLWFVKESMELLGNVLEQVECHASFVAIRDHVLIEMPGLISGINEARRAVKYRLKEDKIGDIDLLGKFINLLSDFMESDDERVHCRKAIQRMKLLHEAGKKGERREKECAKLFHQVLESANAATNRINSRFQVVLADKEIFDALDDNEEDLTADQESLAKSKQARVEGEVADKEENLAEAKEGALGDSRANPTVID